MKTSPGDIIVLHLYTTNDNHINVSLLKYGVQQTAFFVIWSIFLPLYPPTSPENQNFRKMLADITI